MYVYMPRKAHTIVLPEDAPQSKILDTVNLSRGEDAPIRILGLIDACGYDGQVFVHLEPGISLETIRNQIKHCCQNSHGRSGGISRFSTPKSYRFLYRFFLRILLRKFRIE